jgi:hypothetical protein
MGDARGGDDDDDDDDGRVRRTNEDGVEHSERVPKILHLGCDRLQRWRDVRANRRRRRDATRATATTTRRTDPTTSSRDAEGFANDAEPRGVERPATGFWRAFFGE